MIKPNSLIFIVLKRFTPVAVLIVNAAFLHSIANAFLKFRAHLSYSKRNATPLTLYPALQFVTHFFVNFSVLLFFGVYKNQLSFVVIISDDYINQIVNKILFPDKPLGPRFASFFPFLGDFSSSSSSCCSSSSSESILSLSLPSLSVSKDLKRAINCFLQIFWCRCFFLFYSV